uniref:Uncharacterized protein n=1 Tax=Hyaloperonospora arabidopsidis (strain Emoy2) TaxID=559515 RepID=M4C257_HYAAE
MERALCCSIHLVLLKACSDSWTLLSLRMSITYMSHHLFLTRDLVTMTKPVSISTFPNVHFAVHLRHQLTLGNTFLTTSLVGSHCFVVLL